MEANYYSDDCVEQEEDGVDNSELKYDNQKIFIRLNDRRNLFEARRNSLNICAKELKKKFPQMGAYKDDEIFQKIIKEEFKDGLVTRVYIRNLSMMKVRGDEEREEDVLALRPERLPGDFLSTLIPTNVSLMLKGHLDRNAFVVDSVYDTSNEECMDYEIECDVTRYDDPNKVKYSFLSKLQKESESLAAHTVEKLEEWKEYLEWNKALLSKKIYGCRYINVAYDEEREKLVFTLVCQSQKWFESFKRNLSRDIQIFNLFYSKDPWGFELADMERKGFDPKEVGKFRGVIEEYYEEQAGSILLCASAC